MKVYLRIMFTALFLISASGFANAQRYWNTAAKVSGNQYIAVRPGPALADISQDFTLECWFKATNANTGATLFGKNGFRLLLQGDGSTLRARIQTNNNTALLSSASAGFNINKWYHLAASYDSASQLFTFYINGSYDTSAAKSGSDPVPGTDSLFIGKSPYGSAEVFIDEIRIWNKRVSSTVIGDNFRTPYFGENVAGGLVLVSGFDGHTSGPFAGALYFAGSSLFFNRGAQAADLGRNPSTTISLNNALKLDGNGDYARMRSNADVSLTGALTLEAWIYPDSLNQRSCIISKGSSSTGYTINYDSGKVGIRMNNTSYQTGNVFMPPEKWTHIAVTKPSGNGMKVYINGVQITSNNTTPPPSSNADSLFIGKGSLLSTFKGCIDAVKISNYEKTPEEVRRSIFEITDVTNQPGSPDRTVAVNFDFYSVGNSYPAFHGDNYELRGNASITRPYSDNNVPVSPVLGANVTNFPEGYSFKSSVNRRIPESNTAGFMRMDSLYVNTGMVISDINFFIALNHNWHNDLHITLFSPAGDSLRVWHHQSGLETHEHLITVFDDQADSTMGNDKYLDFGPRIKPAASLNAQFNGESSAGWWKLRIADVANNNTGWLYGWGIQVNNQVLTGVKNNTAEIPGSYKLEQNYPNPFNPSTNIKFSIPVKGIVKLKIFDVLGKEVAVLLNKEMNAGNYNVDFNGAKLSSGVYFYKLETEAFTDVKRMLLLK